VAQELGDVMYISDAFLGLGKATCASGDNKAGRLLLEQSLQLARQNNIPNVIAFVIFELARLARLDGDYAKAKKLYMECIQLRRQMLYHSGLAVALLNLGQVILRDHDSDQARVLFDESMKIYRELKMVLGQAASLAGFAGIAGVEGKNELAARLLGATQAAYEMFELKINDLNHVEINSKMDDLDHMTYDPIIATAREKLGEAAFNAAWESGREMSLDEAIAYALKEPNE
jgi:tetratricopeptide (TPR) repeat protein